MILIAVLAAFINLIIIVSLTLAINAVGKGMEQFYDY
ncbi:MAG: hypothetical protein BACD_00153 [Bacteroides rodentium]